MNALTQIKTRIKSQNTFASRLIFKAAKSLLTFDLPTIWFIHKPLHALVNCIHILTTFLIRTLYWKPVFILQLQNRPKALHYEGIGLPFRMGPLNIQMGDNCRIASRIALIGRSASAQTPELKIGNNVGIGWQTGIYVGTKITLGDNVRIAEQCTLSGYAGHPLDAQDRALGKPDLDTQARDITLEDDVWLGRGCTVNAGVKIGKGSIIAAGSVVTKDIPAGVLAGGVPAKIIRHLDNNEHRVFSLSHLKSQNEAQQRIH